MTMKLSGLRAEAIIRLSDHLSYLKGDEFELRESDD